MTRDERPLSVVPALVWGVLMVALAGQIAWRTLQAPSAPQAEDLPPAPSTQALRLASFGEPNALARVMMLYLQAFDSGATNAQPYRQLDYARLVGWLEAILALDPRSEYPLFAAARVYADIGDPGKARTMLDFVYQQFFADPDHRWQWLAHAALLAKHRLHDLPLARRYAAAIDRNTRSPDVPLWARQMEIFILEDMNELEAARIMLGGLLASGQIRDPAEARFLAERLKALEERIQREPGR
jgi:GNAT superfamily N-acetyltransferase